MQHTNPLTLARYFGLIVLILLLTIATGVVYGRLSQRWGPVPDLNAVAQQLKEFPREIGEWQMLAEEPIIESTLEMLSCAGYVHRKYVNRKTGQSVSIAILVGPSGPIAVHTPEICYSSRAYAIAEPRERTTLTDRDGRTHTSWSIVFRSTRPSADRLGVLYAWTTDGQWTASQSPRFEFASRPALFKLQVASLRSASAERAENACQEFVSDLLDLDWKINGRSTKF